MNARNNKRDPTHISPQVCREWDRVYERSLAAGVPLIGECASDILINALLLREPKKILEIGTGMGYSTYILYTFKDPDGVIVTVENNLGRYQEALESFQRAGVGSQIITVHGEAEKFLSTYREGFFDFVFMDAQKSQYCLYLDLVSRYLSDDGIIVADDTLFRADRGHDYCEKVHKNTVAGLERFRELIMSDPWQSITYPVEDGISLIWKRRCVDFEKTRTAGTGR